MVEPSIPPIRAWLELDGSPRYQVARFQTIAPISPARMIFSPDSLTKRSLLTMPLAIVAATLKEMKAPTKLSAAAQRTATLGLSARVETTVAIELAVSWKPLVKSNSRATAIRAMRVNQSIDSSGFRGCSCRLKNH